MQVSGPLPEQIVRKLENAIQRLNDDFERVEFWAAALNAFLQPIPRYEAPQSEFMLHREGEPEERATAVAHHPSPPA